MAGVGGDISEVEAALALVAKLRAEKEGFKANFEELRSKCLQLQEVRGSVRWGESFNRRE